jgi:1,2-phenylacetyl-CoA epoxidase PaaB subunit
MSIFRINKESNYSIVSNYTFNDSRLTWEARGVLAYLLTKPDGWVVRRTDLVKQAPNGEYQIRRILKELQSNGYMVREKKRHSSGKFYYVTEVYEQPLGGYPPAAKPPSENHTAYKKRSKKERVFSTQDEVIKR